MTTTAGAVHDIDTTRVRAANIVSEVAARLADPQWVAETASLADNVDYVPELMRKPASPWSGLPLTEGHVGVSLLFSELSAADPRYRTATHAHLRTAAGYLSGPDGECLFGGTPAMAFAARVAQHHPNDYRALLDRLDERVTVRMRSLLDTESDRLDAGKAGVPTATYDAISGVSGIGRYLLLSQPEHSELLADTLRYLVRLTEPVRAYGHKVPGWWSDEPPGLATGSRYDRGHFNLGLAHGICGPLALLSLAKQAGIEVDGQDEAIARIVDHLLPQQFSPGRWRGALAFDEFLTGSGDPEPDDTMIAWCYGTLGVARTLQLAGAALGRTDWRQVAVRTLHDVLDRRHLSFGDYSLCHGWAGLLHIAWRMARDGADHELAARLPEIAEPILAGYNPSHPFGFYYERPNLPADRRLAAHRAGFLEGAAGIALALHVYATDRDPHRPWESALLIT